MKCVKKKLFGVVDLKPVLKCEDSALVEYYISEEEACDEEYDIKKPFGIEVIKKQSIDGTLYREIKTVKHMSDNEYEIERVLAILRRNSVTPITVADVLEDLAVR